MWCDIFSRKYSEYWSGVWVGIATNRGYRGQALHNNERLLSPAAGVQGFTAWETGQGIPVILARGLSCNFPLPLSYIKIRFKLHVELKVLKNIKGTETLFLYCANCKAHVNVNNIPALQLLQRVGCLFVIKPNHPSQCSFVSSSSITECDVCV